MILDPKDSLPLEWKFKESEYKLIAGEYTVCLLHPNEDGTGADFEWNEERFLLRTVGAWKMKTIITDAEGNTLMTQENNFWGTKSHICFDKGNEYEMRIRNTPLVTLVFEKPEGEELFRYKLSAQNCNPEVVSEISTTNIPEKEFWLMFVAGAFFIQRILQENMMSDTITILTAGAD